MDQQKIVVKTNGLAMVAVVTIASFVSFIAGLSIGLCDETLEDAQDEKLAEGVYINNKLTAPILYTIGLNALADGVYDEDEIRAMLNESQAM